MSALLAFVGGLLNLMGTAASTDRESAGGWVKFPESPVIGPGLGTCFDMCVLREKPGYRMYFSWRPEKCIATCTSVDGIHWGKPEKALLPAPGAWDADVNRPSVVKRGGVYLMWYTGQFGGRGAAFGLAESKDGVHFTRRIAAPVFQAKEPWEKDAVMCPDVAWNAKKRCFEMWYSAGEEYEPDAIGFAASKDGVYWTRERTNPIFAPDRSKPWEQAKVTACHVVRVGGYCYMFYIGFRDVDTAEIGVARSRNGLDGWERCPSNPIIRRGVNPRAWDHDAVYKPYVERANKNGWILWYNGRNGGTEQIGVALHPAADLWSSK